MCHHVDPMADDQIEVTATAGQALRLWRLKRELTQAAAGLELGCSAQVVAYLERGKHTPSLDVAVRIQTIVAIPCAAWVVPPAAADATAPE